MARRPSRTRPSSLVLPLVRFLSRANAASRVEARRLVLAGRVRVNGRVCRDGARLVHAARDQVRLDDGPVTLARTPEDFEWWMVNKPRGVIATTNDPEGRPAVLDLLPSPRAPGLAPVGRLDKASAGLLLVTNDSLLAARLLDPASHVEKAYRVKVRGHPSERVLAAWRTQSRIVDGLRLGEMAVEVLSQGPRSSWLAIRLSEGKNRQIRRRLGADGHPVEVLIRVAFGPLGLGDLAPGGARRLEAAEVESMRVSAG